MCNRFLQIIKSQNIDTLLVQINIRIMYLDVATANLIFLGTEISHQELLKSIGG